MCRYDKLNTMKVRLLQVMLIGIAFLPSCKPAVKGGNNTAKAVEAKEIDSESLYQLNSAWDDQNGDTITLSKLTGKIPVLAMIFTRCTFSCPRTIDDLKAIEKRLPADKKEKVVFVLVTFDSDRDHTKELKAFVKKMKLGTNWMILHGNEENVRELSMLLDVKYKKQPNGDFTHSTVISLLNTHGAIAAQTDRLGADPALMVGKIKSM
jgi:protein SCO1/2